MLTFMAIGFCLPFIMMAILAILIFTERKEKKEYKKNHKKVS